MNIYHAHYTYIRANSQGTGDQDRSKQYKTPLNSKGKEKFIQKGEKNKKFKQKLKIFTKIKQKMGDDPTPTPKSHNVLIGSRESSPTHKNKENKNKHKKKKMKNIHKLTQQVSTKIQNW